MQTTMLTTSAVESRQERASQVGVFVNVCRQLYEFVKSYQDLDTSCLITNMLPIGWTVLFPRHVHCVGL